MINYPMNHSKSLRLAIQNLATIHKINDTSRYKFDKQSLNNDDISIFYHQNIHVFIMFNCISESLHREATINYSLFNGVHINSTRLIVLAHFFDDVVDSSHFINQLFFLVKFVKRIFLTLNNNFFALFNIFEGNLI